MRHGYFGRKLSRNTNERRRLFMVLARELITRSQIKTTPAKAKAVQGLIDTLVTHAKRGNRQELFKVLADTKTVESMLSWGRSRFNTRTSGFTRITKLGARSGDNSEEVLFSFVDPVPIAERPAKKPEEQRHQKGEKTGKSKPTAKRKLSSKPRTRK